jgi:hypothetical protein
VLKRRIAAPIMAAAIALGFAGTAQAKEIDTIIWAYPAGSYSDNGRAYFSTYGDYIGVDDQKKDDETVCVQFYAKPVSTGKRDLFIRCNAQGSGTSKDWNFDFVENSEVNIRVFMASDGSGRNDHAYGEWVSTIA